MEHFEGLLNVSYDRVANVVLIGQVCKVSHGNGFGEEKGYGEGLA